MLLTLIYKTYKLEDFHFNIQNLLYDILSKRTIFGECKVHLIVIKYQKPNLVYSIKIIVVMILL